MKPEDIQTLVEEEVRTEIFYPKIDQLDDGILVEIGTFVGGNACRVANYIKERKKKITLFTIDNFQFGNISQKGFDMANLSRDENFYNVYKENVDQCNLNDIICYTNSDSIEASQNFKNDTIDLIFIDGAHNEVYCRDELMAWIPKIKPGGIISGHDWPAPCIQRAFYSVFPMIPNITSTGGAYWITAF